MIRVVLDTEYSGFRAATTTGLARPDLLNNARRDHRAAFRQRRYLCRIRRGAPASQVYRSDAIIEAALIAIRQTGFWVKPSEKVHVCSDADDDIFLECAQAARAHYVVTGNLKDFPPKWVDAQIVTARQFLDVLADIPEEPR